MLRSAILLTLTLSPVALMADGPSMIGYSMSPNAYVDDHAPELRKLYDGFFYSVGTWEHARQRFGGDSPKEAEWLQKTRSNIAALRKAGATENFLTVAFDINAAWPSPDTLLSAEYTDTMAAEYAALARTARALGFRGLCIDVEYPYKRYELTHEIYTYQGYTAEDLLDAAHRQGRGIIQAVLREFPDAVIWSLPGEFRGRPVLRSFSLGMLEAMAEKDAPGGFHQGTEFTYSLTEPVSHLAGTRLEDVAMHQLVDSKTLAYWRKRCTMAPGVWPLHMVETGGKDYPIQPWEKEMEELTAQMRLLRAASKRYIWSFTSNPSWYIYSTKLEAKYGLKKQDLKREDIDLRAWHELLASRTAAVPDNLKPLLDAVRKFDQGELTPEALCERFGTPPRWWVLGYVGHFKKLPQFTGEESLGEPVDPQRTYQGRDAAVRWFPFDNLDLRGHVNPAYVFEYRNTDNAGAHFSTFVESPSARQALLHLGWDDIVVVRLNGEILFDTRDQLKPKGAQFRDRYSFEKAFPVNLKRGSNRLDITTYNWTGRWVFDVRLTGMDGIPFADLRFAMKDRTGSL